jgi:hypothetical protein
MSSSLYLEKCRLGLGEPPGSGECGEEEEELLLGGKALPISPPPPSPPPCSDSREEAEGWRERWRGETQLMLWMEGEGAGERERGDPAATEPWG